MSSFTNFEKMITPVIIKILFWIGVVFSVLMGLILFIGGIAGNGGSAVLAGLILMLIGPLFTRVQCELLIVIFKIHETLNEINQKIDNKNI